MPTMLELPLPCKLNALYRGIRAGAWAKMAKTKEGTTREFNVLQSIADQLGVPEPYTKDCYINIRWRNTTRHKHDIDGIIKQLLDCLTKGNVIKDDSLIKSMTVELEDPIPKTLGRVLVEIGEL